MNDLSPLPATLVDSRGVPHEGAFAGTFPRASLDGGIVGRLRRKSWRWVGIFRDDLVIAAAVADIGYLGVAFAYVAEGSSVVERAWKAPGAVGMKVGAADGASVALAPLRLISLAVTRSGGLTFTLDLPGIQANVDVAGDATPLTVVSDVGHGSGAHGITVKGAGLVARGTVAVEGRNYALEDARACVDWTEASFPRHTAWFWAAGAGLSVAGQPLGFNLAFGIHDDVHGRFNENALWLDGVPSALPGVTFTPGEGSSPWTVHSEDGSVDLVFEPRGERGEKVKLLLVRSRFRQAFGTFTGRLRDARGRVARLESVPGVAEDHEAVW